MALRSAIRGPLAAETLVCLARLSAFTAPIPGPWLRDPQGLGIYQTKPTKHLFILFFFITVYLDDSLTSANGPLERSLSLKHQKARFSLKAESTQTSGTPSITS